MLTKYRIFNDQTGASTGQGSHCLAHCDAFETLYQYIKAKEYWNGNDIEDGVCAVMGMNKDLTRWLLSPGRSHQAIENRST